MRIRGYDEDTEEFSKDLENISGDIADLTKVAGKGGISIFTDSTRKTYKSTYQILKEISEIWDKLTDKQQAQLLEKLGGKRGAQSLAGLLSDFSAVEQAMTTMQNSAGSADREMGIIEQSLSYKINALRETWVGTLTEMGDTSALGGILDFLTTVSEKIGDVTSSIGLIGTTIGIGGTIWGTQHLGLFSAQDGKITADAKNGISGILTNAQRKDNLDYLTSIRKEIETLYAHNTDSDIGSIATQLNQITLSADDASDSVKDFVQNLIDTKVDSGDALSYVDDEINNIKDTAGGLKTALANIGANLLNAFASAGISAAISLIVAGIGKIITSEEDLAKETQEISSKFQEQKNQLTEYSGEIIKLRDTTDSSTASIEEKKEATSQLYKIQNDLIDQYGAYHQNLDIINGDLEEQLDLLQGINKENAQRSLNEINNTKSNRVKAINLFSNGSTGGWVNTLNNYFNENQGLKDSFINGFFNETAFKPNDTDVGTYLLGRSDKHIKEEIEKYDTKFRTSNKTLQSLARNYSDIFTVHDNGDIDVAGNVYEVNDAVVKLQTQLKSLGVTDEEVFSSLGSLTSETSDKIEMWGDSYQTIMEGEITYNETLSKSYKDLTDIRNEYLEAQADGDTDKVEELGKKYAEVLDGIMKNPNIDESYKEYFDRLYSEMTQYVNDKNFYDETVPNIQKHVGLEDYLQNNSYDYLIAKYKLVQSARESGVEINPTLKGYFEEIENQAADAGYASAEEFISAFKSHAEYSEGMQSIRDAMGDAFTDEDAEYFTEKFKDRDWTIPIDFKPKPDGLKYTKEEIEEYINPVEIETAVSASDAIDSMADMKTAVGSLNDLWQQTVANQAKVGRDKKYIDENGSVTKQVDDNGLALGYADPALLTSVRSAFSKFSEDLENKGDTVGASKINNVLSQFEETLVKFPGDADKAQRAMNALITAYIDQAGLLDDLDEGTAEWAQAQLEAMDITNAEDVVVSRLNKDTKKLLESLDSLSTSLDQIDESKIGAPDFDMAPVNEMSENLSQAFAVDMPDGSQILPDFNANWILENLDLVKAAVSEDIDAIYELQKVAAQKVAAQVEVNSPAQEEIYGIRDYINGLINSFNIQDVEVGTSLDDTPLIQGLNHLVEAGKLTRDSMNAILSSIGVKPVVSGYETIEVTAENIGSVADAMSGGNATARSEIYKGIHNKTGMRVRVPIIGYVQSSKPTGAQYAPSSGGSSGTGGGSGNGGSSGSDSNKDESEETFDWVEKAIQRVEEEINRLDEVVENVYTIWSKRNSSLKDEIAEVTKEIEIQADAARIYQEKADAVKLTEKDLRKVPAYYVDKIKKGEHIDVSSIETIKGDEALIKKIQDYQTWYEKAIAAQDAQKTLEIKLGELYKRNFDQWKENYEEQINIVQAYADLVDKRITRVQERGYFESQKYYKQLISYEGSTIQKQRDELNELIKARDEAVASGKIKKNSQAWREMTQEILGVAGAIEESTTNLVKWNKQMRQLDWDVFDFMEERIDQVNQEADFLIDLLDNQKMYKDTGNFNQRGWGAVEMRAVKYDTYMQQSRDYAKERAKIEKELAKDPADKELIKRKEELIKLQQESISNAYAEKEAVKDLVQEGINIHLEALQELIDKYKESLNNAKDLYDYQKNIADQTKNINSLEKQLAAYSGDDSEENRARVQQLRKQLEDAQTQLKETEWDKYISETEKFLDDMYEDYEKLLNERLEDIDGLMHDMISDSNENWKQGRWAINHVASDVAYKITDPMKTIIDSNGNITSDFAKKFEDSSAATLKVIENIQKSVDDIKEQMDKEIANEKYGGYAAVYDYKTYKANNPDLAKKFGNDENKYFDHFMNHGMKEGRVASKTFDVKKYKKNNPDLAKKFGNDWEKYYDHYLTYGIAEGRKAYAKGSRNIPYNQLAWTQEEGTELIFRKSDGAMLTPLGAGDKVFTKEMTDNLYDFAKNSVGIPSFIPQSVNNQGNDVDISIVVDKVVADNPEQFARQLIQTLKNNPRAESIIQEMTLGQALGNGKLNKRKY